MKTVFFGGTFDPVHNGHIRLARHILDKKLAQKVLLVPVFTPPHLKSHPLSPFKVRYKMLDIATDDEKNIEISDIESKMESPSYTYKTLKRLQQERNEDISLMIGEDQLKVFDTWYEYKKILKEFKLIVFKRGEDIPENIQNIVKDAKIVWTELSCMDISSTVIREKVRRGIDIKEMVPSGVAEYIERKRLYRR